MSAPFNIAPFLFPLRFKGLAFPITAITRDVGDFGDLFPDPRSSALIRGRSFLLLFRSVFSVLISDKVFAFPITRDHPIYFLFLRFLCSSVFQKFLIRLSGDS
jgi:hypothetical protein